MFFTFLINYLTSVDNRSIDERRFSLSTMRLENLAIIAHQKRLWIACATSLFMALHERNYHLNLSTKSKRQVARRRKISSLMNESRFEWMHESRFAFWRSFFARYISEFSSWMPSLSSLWVIYSAFLHISHNNTLNKSPAKECLSFICLSIQVHKIYTQKQPWSLTIKSERSRKQK